MGDGMVRMAGFGFFEDEEIETKKKYSCGGSCLEVV